MHHPRPEAENTASAAPFIHKVTADPEGDVILAVINEEGAGRTRDFLASSKLLKLASPVFAKMFAPCFREGTALQSSSQTCPTIQLEEDNPDAMELLLRALHFDTEKIPETAPSPDTLAKLAILSDKYDCNRAMKPWIALWFCNVDGIEELDQQALGKLVLAAYLFRSAHFEAISADVVTQLTTNFTLEWAEESMLQTYIPESVIGSFTHRIARRYFGRHSSYGSLTKSSLTTDIGSLSDEVERLRAELRHEMEQVEWKLRQTTASYTMWRIVCPECNRTHPDTAKKCHPCNNTCLSVKYCNFEVRIAEYFAALRTCGLWPSSMYGSLSAGELVAKMVDIPDSVSDHKCKGAQVCPFNRKRFG